MSNSFEFQIMTSYFNWTETKKYEFICLVQKENGHRKTDVSYKIKWETILTKLKDKTNFSELSIKAPALQNTFERFKDQVLKECGISEEGANLSGLPAEASEYVKLIVAMAEEELKRSVEAKSSANKKKTIQKGLLTHEVKALKSQGQSFNLADDSTIPVATVGGNTTVESDLSPDSNSSSSSADTKAGSRSGVVQVMRGKNFMDKFTESIAALTEDDQQAKELEKQCKEMELRHKDQEFQDRQEEKRRRLELDERTIALQERQLAVFEALLGKQNQQP